MSKIARFLKRHDKKLRAGSLRSLFINSFIGVISILLFAFFVITGYGYLKNLIVPSMKNPDSIDSSIKEIELPPYSTPDDLTQLTSGTIIYSGAINTLAKVNFPQFSSVADIPDEYLVSFGLWQAILSETYSENLNYSDESVKIAASAVYDAAKEYFNFGRELTYQDNSLLGNFRYHASTAMFTTPITGIESTFLPRVKSVVSVDNIITLKLEFINSDEQWAYDEHGGSGSPDANDGVGLPEAKRAVDLKISPDANKGYKIISMSNDVM